MGLLDNDIVQTAAAAPEVPGVDDHPAALIPTPQEVAASTPEAPAFPVAPGQTQRREYSVSYKGMTDSGLKKTRALGDRATRLAADDMAPVTEMYADAGQDAENNARLEREAAQERVQVEKDHAAREMEHADALRNINETAAKAQQTAWDSSKQVQAKYLAGYEQQLAGVRQLATMTGNPYAQMGAGEALGLMAAHFVQGFLAPAGINIDVAGMTERWVNRSIQEHQQKIQNAREGAQDQLHLYQIARETSQDDYEARERYRGMVLEGLKAQVAGESSRFNSELANSNGKARIAEIDSHLSQTKLTLGEHRFQQDYQFRKMRIEQAHQQAQDGAAAINAHANMLDAQTRAKAQSEKVTAKPDLWGVYDPFEPRTDKSVPKWGIDRKDTNGMEKFREKEASTRAIAAQLDKLEHAREMAYKAVGGAPISAFAASKLGRGAEEIRTYERELTATIGTIRKAQTGAAFTKEETAEYLRMLPGEHFFESGDNTKAIPQLREKIRGDFQAAADTYDYTKSGAVAGPMRKGEYDTMMSGDPGKQSAPERMVASVNRPDMERPVEATPAFTELMGPGNWAKGTEPAKMEVVEKLAKLALDASHARGELSADELEGLPNSDEIAQDQARMALRRIAADKNDDANNSDIYIADYAQKVLERIETDPEGMKGLLGHLGQKTVSGQWTAYKDGDGFPLEPVK